MVRINSNLLLVPVLANPAPQQLVPGNPLDPQGGQDEKEAQLCYRQNVPLLATGKVQDFKRAVAAYQGLKKTSPKAKATQQFALEIERAFVNQVNEGVDLALTSSNRSQVLSKTAGLLRSFGTSLEDEGVQELLGNMESDLKWGLDFKRYFTAVHLMQLLMPISDARLRVYLYLGDSNNIKLLTQAAVGSELGRGFEVMKAIDKELNGFNPDSSQDGAEVASNHMDLARLWAARGDFARAVQDSQSGAQFAQQAMAQLLMAQAALEKRVNEEKDPQKRRTLWKQLADNSFEGIALANRLGSIALLPGFWGKVLDAQKECGNELGKARLQKVIESLKPTPEGKQGLSDYPAVENYYPIAVNLLTALMKRDDADGAEKCLQAATQNKDALLQAVKKNQISTHDFVETASYFLISSAKVSKAAHQDALAQGMDQVLDELIDSVCEPFTKEDKVENHLQLLDVELTTEFQAHLLGEDPAVELKDGLPGVCNLLLADLDQGQLKMENSAFQALLSTWVNQVQTYFRAGPSRKEAYEILRSSLQSLMNKAKEKANAAALPEEKYFALGLIAEAEIGTATDSDHDKQATGDAIRNYQQVLDVLKQKKELSAEDKGKQNALMQRIAQLNSRLVLLSKPQAAGGK